MNKIFLIAAFLILHISCIASYGIPRPIPLVVNIDSLKNQFPDIYALAQNHFIFKSKKPIDSVYFLEEPGVAVIDSGNNHYVFGLPHGDYRLAISNCETKVIIAFTDGSTDSIKVNIVDFPPVKILFCDSLGKEFDATLTSVHYTGSFYCHAVWSPPLYADMRVNVKGHFRVNFMNDRKPINIMPLEGWYDTGDYTHNIQLSDYSYNKRITAVVDEESLYTIIGSNFNTAKTKLTQNSRKQLEFILSEK